MGEKATASKAPAGAAAGAAGGTPPDDSTDQLLDRMKVLTGECIEAYAGLAKRGLQALGGDDTARQQWFRDAWMTWAGLAGHVVEAGYVAASLADVVRQPPPKSDG